MVYMKINKNLLTIAICSVFFSLMACDMVGEDRINTPFSQHWQAPMEYDDSGATKSLCVAAVSFNVDTSQAVNRSKMTAFIDKIKSEQSDVRFILFPETTLGYYYRPSNPKEYQKSIAETIPGETTDILSQKAIEHQVFISFGMAEKSGEDLFNSQVLINPSGTVVSVYRKQYLTTQDKESGFKAGNDFNINIIDNIKVAAIICNDMNYFSLHKKYMNQKSNCFCFRWQIPRLIPFFKTCIQIHGC
jgi:predicted amidohydrolase